MNSSILVDTNILIYAIDEDSKFHNRALNFLSEPSRHYFVTSKNISEFLVALTRNIENNLSTRQYLTILNGLLVDIDILYPNSKSVKVFCDLINKYNPRGLWIHDIEIASIGIANGVSKIATRNVDDFCRIDEIEVIEI